MIDWVNNIGVGERAGLFEVVPHRPEKYHLDGKRTSYLRCRDLARYAVRWQLFAMVGPHVCGRLPPVICHGEGPRGCGEMTSYLPWWDLAGCGEEPVICHGGTSQGVR